MTLTEKLREKLAFETPPDISCKGVRELYFKFGREHEDRRLAQLHEKLIACVEALINNAQKMPVYLLIYPDDKQLRQYLLDTSEALADLEKELE